MKYYCWFGRDNKFHADTQEQDWDNHPYIAFYIETVEAENVEKAEEECKQIMRERFKKMRF